MEELARRFDLPKDSAEYAALAESAWMGGELVGVRFYLGHFIGRNLFREPDDVVEHHLVEYISRRTSATGARAIRGLYGWSLALEILRHHFERSMPAYATQLGRTRSDREIDAVEVYLADPSKTIAQLASELGTTEKQLARNSLLTLARDLVRRRLEGLE